MHAASRFLLALLSTSALALGQAKLVDILPGSQSVPVAPLDLAPGAQGLLVSGWTGAHASDFSPRELLLVDAQDRTARVVDRYGAGVQAASLTRAGSRVFFTARSGDFGRELWSSDGTAAGTQRVGDFVSGAGDAQIAQFSTHGNEVDLFELRDGRALHVWTSDGSAQNTRELAVLPDHAPLRNIFPAPPAGIARAGTYRVFAAWDSRAQGAAIYATSNTKAPTLLVAPAASTECLLAGTGQRAFALRHVGTPKVGELWSTNGTPQGTARVALPSSWSVGSSDLVAVAGKLYFAVWTASTGAELAVYDPATQRASILEGIPGSSGVDPSLLTPFGSRVLFRGSSAAAGREVWVSDGTPSGTRLFADLVAGAASSDPLGFAVRGSTVLAHNTTSLYQTDGTPAGTRTLQTQSRILGFAVLGNTVYTRVPGTSLVAQDLTTRATRTIALDIRDGLSSEPRLLRDLGDRVYLSARRSATRAPEAMASDGSASGTTALVNAAPLALEASGFETLGQRHVFPAKQALWSYAPASGAARRFPLAGNGQVLARVGGSVLYQVHSSLYASDGVNAPRLVHTLSYPLEKSFELGGMLVGTSDGQLVVSDGTRVQLLPYFYVDDVCAFGDEIAFIYYDTTRAQSMLGFRRGNTTRSFALRSPAHALYAAEGLLFVQYWDGSLDCTFGTAQGTRRLTNDVGGAKPSALASSDRLYFTKGHELWVSSGTAATTRAVCPLGVAPSEARLLLTLGSRLLFATGQQLWLTDRAATQKTRVRAATTGRPLRLARDETGSPSLVALHEGKVFVAARASADGEELWVLEPGASSKTVGTPCAAPSVRAPRLTADEPRLGQTWTLIGHDFASGQLQSTFFGAPTNATPVGTCLLHMDLASLSVLAVSIPPSARWTLSLPIPNDASLLRVSLNFQSVQVSNAALGLDLSSAAQVRFGR